MTALYSQFGERRIPLRWINFFDPEVAAQEFDLPGNEEILMFLDLGYASDDNKPLPSHSQRKELSETVTFL